MTEGEKLTPDNKKLRTIIQAVLNERFDDVAIDSINIMPDVDEDGDRILHVEVVFDGKQKQLDASKTSTVLRHMLPKFAEIGERGFPVISYIAKSEIRKSKAATA